MSYFIRINTLSVNPLISEAVNVNKKMHEEGHFSWYTLALNLFKEIGKDSSDFKQPDDLYKKLRSL